MNGGSNWAWVLYALHLVIARWRGRMTTFEPGLEVSCEPAQAHYINQWM
jgi:hypothetical protein